MLEPIRSKDELLREMRGEAISADDEAERDQILRNALTYLSSRGVLYVPLAIEEDIQTSYEDDTLDEFRDTVRGWIAELVRAGKDVA